MQDLLEWNEQACRQWSVGPCSLDEPLAKADGQDFLYYAIYTAPPGSTEAVAPEAYEFAGTISIMNTNPHVMMAEVGWVLIMPKFQVRR